MAYKTFHERVAEVLELGKPIAELPSDYNHPLSNKKYIGMDIDKNIYESITPENINKCLVFKEI